jgi:hypothetical protein
MGNRNGPQTMNEAVDKTVTVTMTVNETVTFAEAEDENCGRECDRDCDCDRQTLTCQVAALAFSQTIGREHDPISLF